MKLTYKSELLSITSFPEIDLPAFTLITGVNGAGKTQLLRAIEEGKILNDLTTNYPTEVKFHDWSTLVPNDAGKSTSTQVLKVREDLIQICERVRSNFSSALQQHIDRFRINEKLDIPAWDIVKLTKDELFAYLPEEFQSEDEPYNTILSLVDNVAKQIKQQSSSNLLLIDLSPLEIATLTFDGLDELPIAWHGQDLFKQSFSQLFLSYFERHKLNKLNKLDAGEGVESAKFLSEVDFINKHGNPPWEFVNNIIVEAGLDFHISHPSGYTTTTFIPKLTKISSGVEINFSQLSSGEKILMSFAFCLYYAKDDRQNPKKPKLLLFDEVDATLHPSMSRQLINTITESLVESQGIHVVMATHSPSTIAVAPEESVYVMKPNDPGLHKVSKRQAVSVLTAEIPTLSINFDGRRQVFVEDQTDAERFDLLYRNLASEIDSERSLVFIGVGKRKENGEAVGSGCSQVKAIVKSLRDGGNESVYGLIDWDTSNTTEDKVHVLGEGNRYAIENCLLDPLLLMALLIREDWNNNVKIGLTCNVKYTDTLGLGTEALQLSVDTIQRIILEVTGTEDLPDTIPVRYLGGFELLISQKYLHMQGKELEEKIMNSFAGLRRLKNNGKLMKQIINQVIADSQDFVPMDIIDSFERLLNDDS